MAVAKSRATIAMTMVVAGREVASYIASTTVDIPVAREATGASEIRRTRQAGGSTNGP